MRRTRRTALLLTVILLSSAFQCGGPKTIRGRVIANTDRLANTLQFVGGTVRDLHAAGKLSDAQAREWAEALLKANTLATEGTEKLLAYVRANPEATDLPVDLKIDINRILELIEKAIQLASANSDSNLLRAVSEVVATVNAIRRLTR